MADAIVAKWSIKPRAKYIRYEVELVAPSSSANGYKPYLRVVKYDASYNKHILDCPIFDRYYHSLRNPRVFGRVLYDYPERVPNYVKEMVWHIYQEMEVVYNEGI